MDNILTHLLAGLGAGFFAVCIGSPVDVVGILFLLPLLLATNCMVYSLPMVYFHLHML